MIFSPRTREAIIAQLPEREFALLIVGGGITGAALAHRAAREGLSVALVDKGDFACGSSSRSSRLIHGGLRYLGRGQIRIVADSLREQTRLAQAAPHLVRAITFLFPLYHGSPVPHWIIRGLISVYQGLRPRESRLWHRSLSPQATLEQEPLLRREGLRGSLPYQEFYTHDARLVLETILAARSWGASTVNYVRLVDFLSRRGRTIGGILQDQVSGRVVEVRARVVVNAVGPWRDALVRMLLQSPRRLRLTKGVHVMLPRSLLPITHGINLFSPRDGRPLMLLPMANVVMVGPTETPFEGDPDEVRVEAADRAYLLEVVRAYFPEVRMGQADVIGAIVGLRPLYDQPHRSTADVSRAYRMGWGPEGLLSVMGGKLTLHRRAAEDVLRLLRPHLGTRPPASPADDEPLPGAQWVIPREQVARQLLRDGIPPESVTHLIQTYGSRSVLFLDVLREDPSSRALIDSGLPHIWGEIPFSIQREMAIQPEDFLTRRSDVALYAAAEGRDVAPAVERGWRRSWAQAAPRYG